MRAILYLIPLLIFTSISKAQSLYFPPTGADTWDTLSAETLGYCPEQIDSLYQYLEENDSKAFLLLKDGKIVLEKYFGTFSQDSSWYWASAGKTYTAMLVGIAQEEGILSIDDTTSQYLGQGWTNCTPEQEAKITIYHQLSMSTGLDEGVPNPDCKGDSCLLYKADAGARWAYHNGPYTLLTTVLENATGEHINQYQASRIRNKIGMNGGYIPLGDNRVFFSTPRSMARYGLLLLAEGHWNGIPVLGDGQYFGEMINSSQDLNLSYGYLTWLNGKSSFMVPQVQFQFPGSLNEDAPEDLYAAMGKNGQLINVVPSQNLVWIRMGDQPGDDNGLISPVFNNKIWQYINQLECVASDVKALQTDVKVTIYPNPARSFIHMEAATVIQRLRLFDVQGKLLKTELVNSKTARVRVGEFPDGLYVVRMELEGGEVVIEKVWVGE